MKTCTKCLLAKSSGDFSKHLDKLRNICKECQSVARRSYYAANREKETQATRKWHEQNRDAVVARQFEWRKNNPDKVTAYRVARKAEECERSARYYASKTKATPPWADLEAIRSIYREAEALRQLGFDVHVDHVFPLRGKTVSGLHVRENLQLLSGQANRSKGNKVCG